MTDEGACTRSSRTPVSRGGPRKWCGEERRGSPPHTLLVSLPNSTQSSRRQGDFQNGSVELWRASSADNLPSLDDSSPRVMAPKTYQRRATRRRDRLHSLSLQVLGALGNPCVNSQRPRRWYAATVVGKAPTLCRRMGHALRGLIDFPPNRRSDEHGLGEFSDNRPRNSE